MVNLAKTVHNQINYFPKKASFSGNNLKFDLIVPVKILDLQYLVSNA